MKNKLIASVLATVITTVYIPQEVLANTWEYIQRSDNNINYVNGTYTVKNDILNLFEDSIEV